MSTTLTIQGLDQLKDDLKRLPPELVSDGGSLVTTAAQAAAQAIEASYPIGPTGNLKPHVTVAVETSAVHATARVKSTARHAYIFEKGTGPRAWKRNGKNTGAMPAHNNTSSFVDIAVRRRAAMHDALIELVERAGLTVTGS